MSIQVVPYDPTWPAQFRTIATSLCAALTGVPILSIEHVGSTSVPNLAAKPIIDVDIIVARPNAGAAIAALQKAGYAHQGNLGLVDRDSFAAPPASTSPRASPNANIYLCVEGTVHLRNHLAVREALRSRPDLRDEYAHVKRQLAAVPGMHIDRYLAGKSGVLAKVLDLSDLTEEEKRLVRKINDPDA
jgi:GrpB-like predicted nucleotidyltransferase (UPF0157 family)